MTQKTKYTISAAARITGKSPTTIRKHIGTSDLSVEVQDNGKKLIDASELIRVYGDSCNFDREEGRAKPFEGSTTIVADHELKAVQEELKQEQSQHQNDNQQYQDQIEFLRSALEKSQDGHNRATHLLENHSQSQKEWEPVFEKLQTQFANLQDDHKKEHVIKKLRTRTSNQKQLLLNVRDNYKKKLEELQKALESEREKPLWKKVFGAGD